MRRIRAATAAGTINLNSNASLPEVVEELAELGLDSLRVSLNSARREVYAAYYRPRGYTFDDVDRSMQVMTRARRFVSLNLLYFPGVTDRPAEVDALAGLIEHCGVDDDPAAQPEHRSGALPAARCPRARSVPGWGWMQFQRALLRRFPRLRFGYFNPPKERYLAWRAGGP